MTEPVVYKVYRRVYWYDRAGGILLYTGEYTSTTELVVYCNIQESILVTELVEYYTREYTSTTEPVVFTQYRRVYLYDRAGGIHAIQESILV